MLDRKIVSFSVHSVKEKQFYLKICFYFILKNIAIIFTEHCREYVLMRIEYFDLAS